MVKVANGPKSRVRWINVERIIIPNDADPIISASTKGDQSKWLLGNTWVKENNRGYENIAEYVAFLILESSNLPKTSFVPYTPCLIEKSNCTVTDGCYSNDFRGSLQEVTLERLFEANFESTDDILGNGRYSTEDKFNAVLESYNRWAIVRKTHGVMADDEIWLRFKGETLKHRDVTLRKSLYYGN